MDQTRSASLRPPNPFGIHYLKFLVVVSLFVTHGIVWVGHFAGTTFSVEDGFWSRVAIFAFSSFLIPITAGAVQAITLNGSFVNGRLQGVDLKSFAWVMAGLAFLESFKAAFVMGPGVFFAWNVLHMLAVSLLMVLWLARRSIHWVWASAIFCLLVTPALRWWLAPWQIDSLRAQFLDDIGVGKIFLMIFGLLVLGGTLYLIFRSKAARQYKWRMTLLGVIVFNVFLFLISRVNFDFYFSSRVASLPVGALVGDRLGMHFWPLFPWYAMVAGGFTLYYFFARTSQPRHFRMALLIVGLVCTGLFNAFYFEKILIELDPRNIWTGRVFGGHLSLVLDAAGTFALHAWLCDRLTRSIRFQNWTDRWPVLFEVPFVFSKTILWAYLFINSIGGLMAYPFAKLLPEKAALILFPATMVILWYGLGKWLMRGLAGLKLNVRLSQVSDGIN